MTKKISDVSIGQIAFGNRQIEGFSSGIWETDEIIVGDNEIDNFCYVLLFPSDEDVYSSSCSVSEFQLCFAFTDQFHQWKFKEDVIVYYFKIGPNILHKIQSLYSVSINNLQPLCSIKLTNFEFNIVKSEFQNIYEEMNRLDMLEGIIYSRIATIFAESDRFVEKRYVNNKNT